ncbi:Leucine-rich repeat receptor-like kinase [Melia azedarach]|uniref:Leucine-rich repeat receptor-like kinase n=1 Tax=Melia azedarach TaxID=155640 RepID=A0ACC1XDQ1_MELAZ|nr:Leucine-rich repeat receptor-like kinase [Melia azedarach]
MLSPIIVNLTNLQLVLLQNKNISGPIPSEIGRLSRLPTLDLSSNSFSGSIPSCVSNLRSLKYLDLSYDKFKWSCTKLPWFKHGRILSDLRNWRL